MCKQIKERFMHGSCVCFVFYVLPHHGHAPCDNAASSGYACSSEGRGREPVAPSDSCSTEPWRREGNESYVMNGLRVRRGSAEWALLSRIKYRNRVVRGKRRDTAVTRALLCVCHSDGTSTLGTSAPPRQTRKCYRGQHVLKCSQSRVAYFAYCRDLKHAKKHRRCSHVQIQTKDDRKHQNRVVCCVDAHRLALASSGDGH